MPQRIDMRRRDIGILTEIGLHIEIWRRLAAFFPAGRVKVRERIYARVLYVRIGCEIIIGIELNKEFSPQGDAFSEALSVLHALGFTATGAVYDGPQETPTYGGPGGTLP